MSCSQQTCIECGRAQCMHDLCLLSSASTIIFILSRLHDFRKWLSRNPSTLFLFALKCFWDGHENVARAVSIYLALLYLFYKITLWNTVCAFRHKHGVMMNVVWCCFFFSPALLIPFFCRHVFFFVFVFSKVAQRSALQLRLKEDRRSCMGALFITLEMSID